jgi:hypothetical protein
LTKLFCKKMHFKAQKICFTTKKRAFWVFRVLHI